MSASDSVFDTAAKLSASWVRVRALKAFSGLTMQSQCCPATRGIPFWPWKPPRGVA